MVTVGSLILWALIIVGAQQLWGAARMVSWIKTHPRLVTLIVANEIRGVIVTAPVWWALLHHWRIL